LHQPVNAAVECYATAAVAIATTTSTNAASTTTAATVVVHEFSEALEGRHHGLMRSEDRPWTRDVKTCIVVLHRSQLR
jgi:hypothetical protein